jgi:hypothetical protein
VGAVSTPGLGVLDTPQDERCSVPWIGRVQGSDAHTTVISHHFGGSTISEPHQRFTFVHPSGLSLARLALMTEPSLDIPLSTSFMRVGTGLDTNLDGLVHHSRHATSCRTSW